MSIFAKFLNPVWDKIERLPETQRHDVAYWLTIPGFLRQYLADELVKPFEEFCLQSTNKAVLNRGQRAAPFPPKMHELLIDEVAIGFLNTQKSRNYSNGTHPLDRLPNGIIEIGNLVTIEINKRRQREGALELQWEKYSQDVEECRLQVLAAWLVHTNLDDPDLIGAVSQEFFAKKWVGLCDGLFRASLAGFQRVPREVAFNKARNICKDLCPESRRKIEGFLEKLKNNSSLKSPAKENPVKQNNSTDSLSRKPVPPSGTPEYYLYMKQYRMENPIFFISAESLLKTLLDIGELNITLGQHPCITLGQQPNFAKRYPSLNEAIRELCKTRNPSWVGDAYTADIVLHSYAVIIGAGCVLQSNWHNCRVTKAMRKLFVKKYGKELLYNGFSRATAQIAPGLEDIPSKFDQVKAGLDMLNMVVDAGRIYAEKANIPGSELILFEPTIILKRVSATSALQPSLIKLAQENLQIATKRIKELEEITRAPDAVIDYVL